MSLKRKQATSPVLLLFALTFVACTTGDAAQESVASGLADTLAVQDPVPRFDRMSEAGRTLAAGLSEAERTDRLVFLHSGAPWCSWCKRLELWLVREDIQPIFGKEFVNVKIDIDEMAGGKALMDAYTGGYAGVPWLAILRPDGSVVITSVAPNGQNIGSPIHAWEVEHWNTMMRKSVRRITEEEIAYMARTWAADRR